MLEQTYAYAPLRVERLQREILVVPVKKEPTQVLYLKAKHSSDALSQCGTAPQNGAAEYLWLSSCSAPLPTYGKTTNSSTDIVNTSAGYNIRSAIAELEKRRASLFALARAAEARAREAEKKCERVENRLEQETNQRLVAEATARSAEEKAQKIEALVLGEEASEQDAARRNLVFGFLVYANRKAEADAGEAKSQLPARIEARRTAPSEKGGESPAIELTMWREGEFTSSNLLKSVGDDRTYRVIERKGPGIKRKFFFYSAVITLLVGMYWLLIATIH